MTEVNALSFQGSIAQSVQAGYDAKKVVIEHRFLKNERTSNRSHFTFPGRLLLVIFGLSFPFVALEIGVRVTSLAPPPEPNPAIWAPHPLFGWWHVPHSGGIFHSDYNEFEANVRINARGLRDREIGYDKPPQTVRILSLADSFGEALQVDLAETYTTNSWKAN